MYFECIFFYLIKKFTKKNLLLRPLKKSKLAKKENSLEFHNKISSNFRELHVDGAYGGITPRGFINLNFFAERFPIPKSSTYALVNQQLSEKIEDSADSKTGLVREYEFGIYFDLATATELHNFLGEKIKELETRNQKP